MPEEVNQLKRNLSTFKVLISEKVKKGRLLEIGIVGRKGTGDKRLWIGIRHLGVDEEPQVAEMAEVAPITERF